MPRIRQKRYQDIWRSTTRCNYSLTTITACKLSDFQVSIRGVKLFEISKRFQQLSNRDF